jgi:hypothetical protein
MMHGQTQIKNCDYLYVLLYWTSFSPVSSFLWPRRGKCPHFFWRIYRSSCLVGHSVCSSVAKYTLHWVKWALSSNNYRGRVVGPPVPWAGDPGFKSGPKDRLSWLSSFVLHFTASRQIPPMDLQSRYWLPVVPSFDAILLSVWRRGEEEGPLNKARMWINK